MICLYVYVYIRNIFGVRRGLEESIGYLGYGGGGGCELLCGCFELLCGC